MIDLIALCSVNTKEPGALSQIFFYKAHTKPYITGEEGYGLFFIPATDYKLCGPQSVSFEMAA